MEKSKNLYVALAGQANVGKSVIFNELTGIHQHIGNWPGKTVEKAAGTLFYNGYTIDIVDLPGIYSLTPYTIEELISRDYILEQKPDFVINVVDSTNLERNLIFTLQLLELERPTVLALNMADVAQKKCLNINLDKLSQILKIPAISTTASQGKGLTEILDAGIELTEKRKESSHLKYGKEVEERINKLIELLKYVNLHNPKRWVAIKLLEKDKKVENKIQNKVPKVLEIAQELCKELEQIYGHDSSVIISEQRCHLASQIVKETITISKEPKISLEDRLHSITCHKIWGYPIMAGILISMFLIIFYFGTHFSNLLKSLTVGWKEAFFKLLGTGIFTSLSWAAIESFLALIDIAVPFLIPFYLVLFTLENSGYFARVAFLLDSLMHKVGVHGKAAIPLLLSFGCNVPGCLSCRIMETQRERLITGILTVFVPCSAVTIIVMKLVGEYVGLGWVFGLYLFAFLLLFILGHIASKILPGEPTELIMEMPDYKIPSLKSILLQTWIKTKKFILMAGPLIIISGIIIEGIHLLGFFPQIAKILSPITEKWLGLPAITGILLVFGILRKELILLMLATLLGTTNFASVLTQAQLIVLALVSMFYAPCVGTMAALKYEFGWGKAIGVTLFQIIFAITLGGIVFRLLNFVGIG